MAEHSAVTAEKRVVSGTKDSRRLRAGGYIPAVVYGHNEPVAHIKIQADDVERMVKEGHKVIDLSVSGKTETCIVKDMQWDTFVTSVLHVDFVRVSKGELITVDVEVELVGDPIGVANGGVLEQPHHTIEIEVPALQTPDAIKVNVSDLKIGDSFTVGDLKLADNIRCTLPEDTPIASVAAPLAEEEPEDTDAPSEPEVIGEKADGEGSGDGEEKAGETT